MPDSYYFDDVLMGLDPVDNSAWFADYLSDTWVVKLRNNTAGFREID
jgi:uncharacterized protein YfeS